MIFVEKKHVSHFELINRFVLVNSKILLMYTCASTHALHSIKMNHLRPYFLVVALIGANRKKGFFHAQKQRQTRFAGPGGPPGVLPGMQRARASPKNLACLRETVATDRTSNKAPGKRQEF
jgi:hypothetical protein